MKKKEYKTKAKECIISYLKEQMHKTVTAKNVFDYLCLQDVNVNLSTVYRNIELLFEEGSVQKFYNSRGEAAAFQYIKKDSDCKEHLHIQCIKCGKLSHLDCTIERSFVEHISDHHGITLKADCSLLYGICDTCNDL